MVGYTKLRKRFIGLLSSTILTSLFNFIFFTGMSLLLSLNDFGEFSFQYSLVYLILPFLEFGSTTLMLSSSGDKNNLLVNAHINMVLIITIVVSCISYTLGYGVNITIILLNVFAAFTFLYVQSYFIKERDSIKQICIALLSGALKLLILLYVYMSDKESVNFLNYVFLLFALSNVIPFLIFMRPMKYNFKIIKVNRIYFKDIFWIAVSAIVATLLMRFDQIIIGHYLDKRLLGYYMISLQWLTIVSLISNTLLKFSFSETNNINVEAYINLIAKKTRIINIFLITIFIIFLISVLGIVYMLYAGNTYILISTIILSIGFLFSIKFNILSIVLYKIKQTKVLFNIQVLQIILQILFIISFYNFLGFFVFPITFVIIRVFGYFYLKNYIYRQKKRFNIQQEVS